MEMMIYSFAAFIMSCIIIVCNTRTTRVQTLKQEVARSQTSPYRDVGWSSGGWNEIFIKVANQLDAVHSSATRISSSAESLGAVEYEARLSAAVQVLILYVDHIKVRNYPFHLLCGMLFPLLFRW